MCWSISIFTVEYETSGRAFGTCKIISDDTDLSSYMVSSGYATVKIGKDGSIPYGREHLVNIQRGASNMEIGIFKKMLNQNLVLELLTGLQIIVRY